MNHSRIAVVVAALLSTPFSLRHVAEGRCEAQEARHHTIAVHVADSSGSPLADVNLLIIKGLREVRATGETDERGRRTLIYAAESGEYELVARKIGFVRVSRFFTLRADDTLSMDIRMRRYIPVLAAVTITERWARQHYFVGADEISTFKRPLDNALDIVRKMRPDMLRSRTRLAGCGALQDIWVNGRRMMLRGTNYGVRLGEALQVLREIKPEHVEEIRYTGCYDNEIPGNGSKEAAFVILKQGVEYQRDRGTRVVADSVRPGAAVPP